MNSINQCPSVSIVILNYNNFKFLTECIESLNGLDYPKQRYEIIVVDNASMDFSADYIEKSFSKVKVIRNHRNFGFAKGNNIGIKNCNIQSKYIALVNNDSRVSSNWLKELVDSMECNPRAGCCGAREEICNSLINIKRTEFKGNWMGGGSVIYRKQALDEVGLFDEQYFAYCEDVDLSWRMKIKGWKIICNKNAMWFHHGAGRRLKIDDKRLFFSLRNRVYLVLKFGSIRQILRSLFKYSFNFISSKKNKNKAVLSEFLYSETPIKSSGFTAMQGFLSKAVLVVRIILSLIFRLPRVLIKRAVLRKGTRVSIKEVDRWIADNDDYTSYNF